MPSAPSCSFDARASASSASASALAESASCFDASPLSANVPRRLALFRAAVALAVVPLKVARTLPISGTRTTARTSPFFTALPSLKRTSTRRPGTGDAMRAVRSGSVATSPGSEIVGASASFTTGALLIFASAMTSLVSRTTFGSSACSGSSL